MKLPLCEFLQSCVTLLSLNFKFFLQQCVASLTVCMNLTESDRTLFVPIIVIQNILAFLGAAIRTLRFRSAYPVCYCPSGTYYKSHGFFRNSRSRIIWNMTSLNCSSNWEHKGSKNVHWSLLNTSLMLIHATPNVCDIIWKFLFVVRFLVHNTSVYFLYTTSIFLAEMLPIDEGFL